MLIDFQRFCQDFRIPVALKGHKHSRRGWINIRCPFCTGTEGYHFGYNLEKGYGFCFRCGWHPVDLTIQTLIKTDKQQVKKILLNYIVAGQLLESGLKEEPYERPDELKWPEGCGPMTAKHKWYLFGRGFDPDRLEKEWGLMGTGNWGYYSFRVIAPIIFHREAVSWQSRDITNKQKAKYLPCPKEQELLHHKQLLYGLDKALWKTVIVVEGITGVWRLGPGSVATFGVEYTPSQLLLLQSFDRVMIFYDGDEPGQDAAEKMAVELTGIGREVEIWQPFSCDSGDISQDKANEIMKEVRK